MRRGRHASRGQRSSRGAAAVEFALVSVVMFPLLFGLIDYGLWFSDTIASRSGAREGVRQAVVQADPSAACAADATYVTALDKMRCQTKAEVGSLSGRAYVMVKTSQDGWVKGKPLTVCTMIRSSGVVGMVPLPKNRIIYNQTRMSIEVDTTKPTGAAGEGVQSSADVLPAGFGDTWSWCA